MANMATYLVFDDHEITDDWNLDWDWEKATNNTMARRILANGLAAYWAFQGWGNDPNAFGADFSATITRHLADAAAGGVSPRGLLAPIAPAAAAYDEALLKRQWSFVAPTNPPALCVDTRTRRETREGHTILSGRLTWPALIDLQARHGLKRGAPLLIILPTPFLQHRSSLWAQQHEYDWPRDRYEGDFEWYGNYPAQRPELIAFLRRTFDPPVLIVFSGDVHHGSVIDGLYVHGPDRETIYGGKGTWAMRVVQVTSSPVKNIKRDVYEEKHWYVGGTDYGNLGESLVPQFENQYATQPDGTVLALRADAMKLAGGLGRETFIFENHLCVVDLPAVAGDDVKALFVGFKDGALATAQTSVSTRNDPATFKPPLTWTGLPPWFRHEAGARA
jgi:hypothetical protein